MVGQVEINNKAVYEYLKKEGQLLLPIVYETPKG
jgi:hypothetical protein